jgi:hypothetical protein
MTRVAGVFDNFQGLPLTPPDIEVLDGRNLKLSTSCTAAPLKRMGVLGFL